MNKILLPAIYLLFILNSCQKDTIREEYLFQDFEFEECLISTDPSTFDIITWNTKEFPLQGEKTVSLLSRIIQLGNPDLIAIQEVSNETDFMSLVDRLPEWEGIILDLTDLNPAFLYKSSEVNLIGTPVALFRENPEAFPRSPVMISVEHQSGLQLFLINIHLKCCSGKANENRRRKASELLKWYVDEKLSGERVMILGDFNDEISGMDSTNNVFYNFIRDSLNYEFTDLDIARGDPEYWSFPGWPSHIDHFLISNELFERDLITRTLLFDQCDSSYFTYISDHRPLIVRIQ
jgi:endonuclease/exonuclease/phosphatase family metal-dependent hydrolase